MPKYDNNLLVVGAGSAGLIAALIGATVRARVTLVERDAMGGDCLNTGCVPSKTLIASANAAHALRDGERYGLKDVTGFVDFDAVMDPAMYIGRAPEQVDAFVSAIATPVRKRYEQHLTAPAELRV